jgi:3-oxoadipate enol-lactonase
MPYLQRNGYRIHYTLDGKANAPVLLLSHSLGAHLGMWDPQVEALGRRFHVLRYDHPGHGGSEPRPGPATPATIEDFGADALALLDELDLEKVSFCGLSLGGMTGLWLGARSPGRLQRMVICSAAARIEDPTLLRGRIAAIRRDGLEAISDSVLAGWFTPGFRSGQPGRVAWARRMLLATQPEAYASTAETVCALDLRGELPRIAVPVLVLYGAEDTATPPAWNRAVQETITGAVARRLAAAHLANVEDPGAFSAAVLGFLATPKQGPSRKDHA